MIEGIIKYSESFIASEIPPSPENTTEGSTWKLL
jgi:hypothetical protein